MTERKPRPRTILHVRALNGHHEVVFRASRRERILIGACAMVVVFDGGTGTVERIVEVLTALAGFL